MSFSFAGLTIQQVAALPSALFGKLSAAEAPGLDGVQAPALSALTYRQIRRLSAAVIARLSPAQFDAILGPNIASLTATQAPGLQLGQIGSLAPSQVATLSASVIAALTPAQFGALSVDAIGALTAEQLAGVDRATFNGLSVGQLQALNVEGLSARVIAGLKAVTLNAFAPSQLSEFTRAQVRALTTTQVHKLSSANLAALNPNDFGGAQVAGLNADYIDDLSVETFDASIARHAASIGLQAIAGLSVAQIESLSVGEDSSISVAQFDVMDSCQRQAVLADGSLIAEAKSLEVDGTLTYTGMLQVLDTAASGGMNAIKFGALNLLASELGSDCGVDTSPYVEQIAQDVINGNSANAWYHGGSSTATALGDLSASSSQAQMEELIGKWFLGADLPSLSVPNSVGATVPSEYEALNLPLFGPGGPSYADVNQGNVGDGYFLAALAETAYLDPSAIKGMIQENPNGTFSVAFQIDGNTDYVTVNNQLPVMLDYYEAANGSALEFANSPYAWSLLIEKAYVQLMEQSGVTPGYLLGQNGNAYADVAGGDGNGISALTGASADWSGLTAGESASALATVAGGLQTDLADHLDVLFASSSLRSGIGNLVNNQMFEVLGVSVAKQAVLLQNPWNGSGLGSGKQMQFWESLSGLAADSDGSADPSGFYIEKAKTVS